MRRDPVVRPFNNVAVEYSAFFVPAYLLDDSQANTSWIKLDVFIREFFSLWICDTSLSGVVSMFISFVFTRHVQK